MGPTKVSSLLLGWIRSLRFSFAGSIVISGSAIRRRHLEYPWELCFCTRLHLEDHIQVLQPVRLTLHQGSKLQSWVCVFPTKQASRPSSIFCLGLPIWICSIDASTVFSECCPFCCPVQSQCQQSLPVSSLFLAPQLELLYSVFNSLT